MSRVVLLSVAIALAFGLAGGERAASAGTASDEQIDLACKYYILRAGPEPLREPVSFTAFLAETCVAARRSIEAGDPVQQAAAERLLGRIAELYAIVADMNADRDKSVAGLTGVTRMLRLTRVTPSGEFLIAHRMGLLKDFDAWLDTGADFSLAWYR